MEFDHSREAITPDLTELLTIGGSGGLELPTGSVGQRPIAAAAGTIRHNQDTDCIEIKKTLDWTSVLTAQALVVRETPIGTIDGINLLFSLAAVPTTGTEHVYLNGLLQVPQGDYLLTTNQLEFVSAPTIGDRILVTYWKL